MTETPDRDDGNQGASAVKDESERQRRRYADLDAATLPRSGAAIGSAFASASLAASDDDSETESELKEAARNGRASQ